MTEKLHGAICETQHEGGFLLLLFTLLFLYCQLEGGRYAGWNCRIVVIGVTLWLLPLSTCGLIANNGGELPRPCFPSGGMPAEVTLREAARKLFKGVRGEANQYRRSGVGGLNGFGSALI